MVVGKLGDTDGDNVAIGDSVGISVGGTVDPEWLAMRRVTPWAVTWAIC